MFFGVFYITAMSLVPGHVNYKGPRHSGSTSHCSNHHIYNFRLSHFIHYSSSYFYHSRYLAPDLKYFHHSLFGGWGRMYRNSCAIFSSSISFTQFHAHSLRCSLRLDP